MVDKKIISGTLLNFYEEGIVINEREDYVFIDRKRIKQIKCSNEVIPNPARYSIQLESYFKNRYCEVELYD